MRQIKTQSVAIDTVGGAGVAIGSKDTNYINGFLLDVLIGYDGAAPATTDVTITDPVFGNLVVKSNNNTEVTLSPRTPTVDGVAALTGQYDLIPLNSALTISVAQADALTDCVTVTIRWLTP